MPGSLLIAAVLLIAIGAGYLVVTQVGSPAPTGLRLAAGEGRPGDRAFPAASDTVDTGESQVLNAVTAVGSTIVAVGSDTTSPVPRPLFLVSTDDGGTWRLGDVSGPAGFVPAGAAGRIAAGGGAWLAAGTDAPGAAGPAARGLWTSSDGLSWVAVDPARLSAFKDTDRITDLARTAHGFVAVGVAMLAGGNRGPVAWVSPDGRSWSRVDTGDIGTPDKVRGIMAVVARGDAVVALAEPGKGDSTSVILRSPDGGRHWLRSAAALAAVRPEPGALAVAGEGFLLVPTRQQTSSGKVTVYCSPEGAEWRHCGAIDGLAATGTGVRAVASSPAGVVAVADSGRGEYVAYVSRDGRSWAKGAELGTISGTLRGVALTGKGLLVAGGDERSGDVDNLPVLITAERGKRARQVPLAEVAGLTRPARDVAAVAADGGRYVAVGAAYGDAGIWTSGDGDDWAAVSAKTAGKALGGPGRQALHDVAHGPKGWVAVGGTMSDPVVTRPLVVTSKDGRAWKQVPAGGDLAVPVGHYALVPHAVAAGPKGYVLAGTDQSATGTRPALWFSADLRRFTRAGKLPGGDGVRILDVAATAAGYVAVGGAGTSGRESPVVWVSDDGLTWKRGGRVAPEDVRSAGLRRVVTGGAKLIAAGTAGTEDGGRAFAAVSADGGRSWRYAWLPAEDATDVDGLAVAGSVLIAVGSHGDPATPDSAAWISPDGLDWQRHDMSEQATTEGGLTGRGAQWLGAVAALGDQVVAIGRSTTYTADHLTLWRTTVHR